MNNPIIASLDCTRKIIGSKWKLGILFYLASGPKRFGELQYHNAGITQRTLSINLQNLQQDGLICKTIYPEIPPRTEYALTEIGRDFIPVLRALHEWGSHYLQTQNQASSDKATEIQQLSCFSTSK